MSTSLCAVLVSASASAQASVTSDQPQYTPGSIAVLSGAGFAPGESVELRVVHADGSPSVGADHEPWSVAADWSGAFVSTWLVCADDCVGMQLLATARGLSSGSPADTTFANHACGNGVVTSVTPVGASCSAFTPAVGNGPDNYEVQEGGVYVMTISGVTECAGDTITVFVQGSSTGNFCFNATGGGGTYSGTFVMPDPACHTYPVSYKCGADAACNHPGSLGTQGPNSGCGGVHLRASNFDGGCNKTGTDGDCAASTVECITLDFETEDDLVTDLVNGQHIDTEFGSVVTLTSSGPNAGLGIFDSSNPGPNNPSQDLDLLVSTGNLLVLQTENFPPDGNDVFPRPNDDSDGGTIHFAFAVPLEAVSVRLVDIDSAGNGADIVLTDSSARTRSFDVPADWTGDITLAQPGHGVLAMNTLASQAGFAASATAVEDAGFDSLAVVQMDVILHGSGGVDDLNVCIHSTGLPRAASAIRNGLGVNPMTLSAVSQPVIGSTWVANLDCSGMGSGEATLVVRQLPAGGLMTMRGEVLVRGMVLQREVRTHTGSPTQMTWEIPSDLSLCGLQAHAQGLCSGIQGSAGPKSFRSRAVLSNALDLVIGF